MVEAGPAQAPAGVGRYARVALRAAL